MMRRLLPLVLLAHSWLLLLPGGVNICVHEDGSWKLESAAFPCCVVPGTTEDHGPRHGPGTDQDGCEDCTDYAVPSMKEAAVARSPGSAVPAHAASLLAGETPARAIAIAVEPWDLRERPLQRPPPPWLRTTTVFRC